MWYHIKALTCTFLSMVRYVNYLNFIFTNINEILKHEEKLIKNIINKQILAPNHHQIAIVASFISSVIQFDKSFHPVVLYENILICIFIVIIIGISTSVGSPSGSWLAAPMADLTLDLHTSLSQGSTSR